MYGHYGAGSKSIGQNGTDAECAARTAAAMQATSRASRERRLPFVAARVALVAVIGGSLGSKRAGPPRNGPPWGRTATWPRYTAGRRPRAGPSPSGRRRSCVRRAWTRLAYPQCIIDQRAVQLPGVSFTLGNHRV